MYNLTSCYIHSVDLFNVTYTSTCMYVFEVQYSFQNRSMFIGNTRKKQNKVALLQRRVQVMLHVTMTAIDLLALIVKVTYVLEMRRKTP